MTEAGDYEVREQRGATLFARTAAEHGVERIIYLGGVVPQGEPSKHLRSRLATGQILRAGPVPCFELQASMIVGAGSLSFRLVRDVATRLPVLLSPPWLSCRSQPVAIDDVVTAVLACLELPLADAGAWALPGPEILTAEEILSRTAAICGLEPVVVRVPLVSPSLVSYGLELVTDAGGRVAGELVEGLRTDLLAADDGIWKKLPGHHRLSFDEAARRALRDEAAERGERGSGA
jgi:uncharacterized protein YbjT (DUF2867 family)